MRSTVKKSIHYDGYTCIPIYLIVFWCRDFDIQAFIIHVSLHLCTCESISNRMVFTRTGLENIISFQSINDKHWSGNVIFYTLCFHLFIENNLVSRQVVPKIWYFGEWCVRYIHTYIRLYTKGKEQGHVIKVP